MRKPSCYFSAFSTLLLISFIFALASGSEAATRYIVKKGDSLSTIAQKLHVDMADLMHANTESRKGLKPGDKLIIPSRTAEKTAAAQVKGKKSVPHGNTHQAESAVRITAETPKAPDKGLYHRIKKGDTLASVSRKYSVSVAELRALNGLSKSAKLKTGQQLLIQPSRPKMYTVKRGDTIWSIAKRFDLDAEELIEINEMDSPALKRGQTIYLEEDRLAKPETQDSDIAAKNVEEELKTAAESDVFSRKGLRDKLTLFAKKLMNIPYKFGGNSILGIDCSAYVKKVYGLLGMDLPRTAREQFNEGETIDKGELSIGALVFFKTYASFPSHVGIYLGNNLFIHASSKGKKVKVDNLDEPYFVKRFIGAKRLLNDEIRTAEPES
jgi:peptidoglycan endopeptidase LytE